MKRGNERHRKAGIRWFELSDGEAAAPGSSVYLLYAVELGGRIITYS